MKEQRNPYESTKMSPLSGPEIEILYPENLKDGEVTLCTEAQLEWCSPVSPYPSYPDLVLLLEIFLWVWYIMHTSQPFNLVVCVRVAQMERISPKAHECQVQD